MDCKWCMPIGDSLVLFCERVLVAWKKHRRVLLHAQEVSDFGREAIPDIDGAILYC